MKLPNIEKSAFVHGDYIGYGAGVVWRIKKLDNIWQATAQSYWKGPNVIRGETLVQISKLLIGFDNQLEALKNKNNA